MGGLLKLVLGNPLYLAIAAAVIFAAGAASGWQVNGWRLGTQLEAEHGKVIQLSSENTVYANANARCGTDVAAVKGAVQSVVDASLDAARKAAAAMQRAEGAAKGHLAKAEEIQNRPPVAPAEYCDTIIKEQAEYVTFRREERLKSLDKKAKQP